MTESNKVPSLASRFWVGVWFPTDWAGDPAFNESDMLVEWVKITPFNEPGDRFERETFACDGWAASSSCAFEPVPPTCSALAPLPPPTSTSPPEATTTTSTMAMTTTTTSNSAIGQCLPCGDCLGNDDCPENSWCKTWQDPPTCKGFPDWSSFDPEGQCCRNLRAKKVKKKSKKKKKEKQVKKKKKGRRRRRRRRSRRKGEENQTKGQNSSS